MGKRRAKGDVAESVISSGQFKGYMCVAVMRPSKGMNKTLLHEDFHKPGVELNIRRDDLVVVLRKHVLAGKKGKIT